MRVDAWLAVDDVVSHILLMPASSATRTIRLRIEPTAQPVGSGYNSTASYAGTCASLKRVCPCGAGRGTRGLAMGSSSCWLRALSAGCLQPTCLLR